MAKTDKLEPGAIVRFRGGNEFQPEWERKWGTHFRIIRPLPDASSMHIYYEVEPLFPTFNHDGDRGVGGRSLPGGHYSLMWLEIDPFLNEVKKFKPK